MIVRVNAKYEDCEGQTADFVGIAAGETLSEITRNIEDYFRNDLLQFTITFPEGYGDSVIDMETFMKEI